MKIKIFKEFGRQSELEYSNDLNTNHIEDFLNENKLQGGTVKRIIELIRHKIPMITIKKKPGRAKNGDMLAFTGVFRGEGLAECCGDKIADIADLADIADIRGGDERGSTFREKRDSIGNRVSGSKEEGMIINCTFVRGSYIGEGMIIKMGGKIKELKGSGRSFEQTMLALKRGDNIAIRYVDDFNWGVL